MILPLDKNIHKSKIRTTSAINGKTFKNYNNFTKRLKSQRITSAKDIMNIPSFSDIKDFHTRNIIQSNNTNKYHNFINNNKKNKTIDINYLSKLRIFSPLIRSPSYIPLNKKKRELDIFHEKENYKEEEKKIKSVLSELLIWDNKQLIENNESFKAARIFCENEKERLNIQKKYTEKNQEFNKRKSELFSNDEKINFELKFSVFDKNYNINKIKNEEEKKKAILLNEMNYNLKNNINKAKQNCDLESEKETSKFENSNREQLMKIYKYIVNNKTKKKKYKEILESTYRLLNKARNECKLSVDILNERIKSIQKYYEKYIEYVNKMKEYKKKKLIYNVDDEKMNKYKEYLALYEEIDKEIKKYEKKYNIVKDDLEPLINEITMKVDALNDEIHKSKYLFNELKEAQIQYYLEKLKKGLDTRNEGLTWIVKQLMELKYKIEPNLFPNFLDQEQIQYIIKMSQLGFESNQLKYILKTLQDKNSEIYKKSKYDNNYIKKSREEIFKETKNNKCLVEDINFEINFKDCFKEMIEEKGEINKKITELQENFSKKEGISPIIEYKIENKKLNLIAQKIKNKMNIYANTKDNKMFEKEQKSRDYLIRYIFGESIEKENKYFKNIFALKERIKKLDNIIIKLKKDEYVIFQEKIKLYEAKEKIPKKTYNLLFKALFGTTIFEIYTKYI